MLGRVRTLCSPYRRLDTGLFAAAVHLNQRKYEILGSFVPKKSGKVPQITTGVIN